MEVLKAIRDWCKKMFLPLSGGVIKNNLNPILTLKRGGNSAYVGLDFENDYGQLIKLESMRAGTNAIPLFRILDITNGINQSKTLLGLSREAKNIYDYHTGIMKEVMVQGEATPVGTVYTTVNADNPSTLFGGAWEKIGDMEQSGNTCHLWKRTS